MSGGKSTNKTTQSVYKPQQDYLHDIWNTARDNYNSVTNPADSQQVYNNVFNRMQGDFLNGSDMYNTGLDFMNQMGNWNFSNAGLDALNNAPGINNTAENNMLDWRSAGNDMLDQRTDPGARTAGNDLINNLSQSDYASQLGNVPDNSFINQLGDLKFNNKANTLASDLAGIPTGNNSLINSLQNLTFQNKANPFIDRVANMNVGVTPSANNEFANQLAQNVSNNPYMDRLANNRWQSANYNPLVNRLANSQILDNPFMNQMVRRAQGSVADTFNQDVLPGLNSTFAGGGRTGGGLHAQQAFQAANKAREQMGNIASDMYGRAYESGADRQAANIRHAANLADQGLNRSLQAFGMESDNIGRAGGLFGNQQALNTQRLQAAGNLRGQDLNRTSQERLQEARLRAENMRHAGTLADQGLARDLQAFDIRAQNMRHAGNLTSSDLDRRSQERIQAATLADRGLDRDLSAFSQMSNNLGTAGGLFAQQQALNAENARAAAELASGDRRHAASLRGQDLDRASQERAADAALQSSEWQHASSLRGQDLDRSSSEWQHASSLRGQDLDRMSNENIANANLRSANLRHAADIYGQDLDRNASMLQSAASMIPDMYNMSQQDMMNYLQWGNFDTQRLQDYANLVGNPVVTTNTNSKSRQGLFGLL